MVHTIATCDGDTRSRRPRLGPARATDRSWSLSESAATTVPRSTGWPLVLLAGKHAAGERGPAATLRPSASPSGAVPVRRRASAGCTAPAAPQTDASPATRPSCSRGRRPTPECRRRRRRRPCRRAASSRRAHGLIDRSVRGPRCAPSRRRCGRCAAARRLVSSDSRSSCGGCPPAFGSVAVAGHAVLRGEDEPVAPPGRAARRGSLAGAAAVVDGGVDRRCRRLGVRVDDAPALLDRRAHAALFTERHAPRKRHATRRPVRPKS